MKHQLLIGIISEQKDEKEIHNNIKIYLKKFNRTTSTAKNKLMLDSHLPFKIKHYHWNLNKDTSTYIEMFPNKDLEDKLFIKNRPDLSWLITVLFHKNFPAYEKNKSEKFIMDLLKAVNYKYEILIETDDMERIKGGIDV